MKNPILLLTSLILISFTFFSCDNDDERSNPTTGPITTTAELNAAIDEIYQQHDAPGFAISVVKEDELLFQRAFGKADVESGKAYTNQTVQLIGSVSKTFVAAAVVKAIDQGYFTMETAINEILPVEVINPKQPNAVIRVKHLVTHTSGLLDVGETYLQAYRLLPGEDLSTEGAQILREGLGFQTREGIPLEEFLAEYYLADGDIYSPQNFAATAPGTSWNYSNLATSLTAYLVEAATGTAFSDYVSTQILQPLGMNNTAYDQSALDPNNLAQLYWDEDTPLPKYANDSYPDGSIHTSNEDLAKFLIEMMRGAKGQTNTLFSATAYDLLFTALLPDGITPSTIGKNQGVFWFLNGENISHTGSDPGTTCNLQFHTGDDAGYLLLTNMDASTAEHETAYSELAIDLHRVITEFLDAN